MDEEWVRRLEDGQKRSIRCGWVQLLPLLKAARLSDA